MSRVCHHPVLVALALAACAPPPDGVVDFGLATDNPFSAVATVTLEQDATVYVEYGSEGLFDQATPAVQVVAGEEVELLVLGLEADHDVDLRWVSSQGGRERVSDSTTLRTGPLPAGWPQCQVESSGTFDDGEVVCTDGHLADDEPFYFCVDREGTPVWSLTHPEGNSIRALTALSDGTFASVGHHASAVIFFDEAGALVDEYEPLWLHERTRFHHDFIDSHELIELTEGPWAGAVAVITVSSDQVDGQPVLDSGIVVLDRDSGAVLWDWSAHGQRGDGVPISPLLDYQRHGQLHEGEDWLHGNALLHGLEPDGGQFFWMSLRNQDWIVKIDVETDEVRWRLGHQGDFELVDDLDASTPQVLPASEWMFHQHAPEWQHRQGSRTRFLLFDNGPGRPGATGEPDWGNGHSRVVELEVDEESMRAEIAWSYGSEHREDVEWFFSEGVGDADMLEDGQRVQFAAGFGHDPYIAEVSYPAGVETWRMTCTDEAELYRVNSYPSLYDVTWWYDVQR